ncbi:MAG: hypothetical protein ACM3X0_02135 [Bacteroidota bacterium]
MTASAPSLPRTTSGLPMLALIVALLALPFVIAGGLYLTGWQPERSGNHGTLLSPPPVLPLENGELQGKWLLILAGRGPCDATCAARIDEMRRIQVSLNKDMGRLRRVVLSDMASDGVLGDFRRRQPDLVIAAAPPEWLPCAGADGTAYRFYLGDPQGRMIMSYQPEVAGKAVRADLDRLLRFSWAG